MKGPWYSFSSNSTHLSCSVVAFHQGAIQAVVISPNGQYLASTGEDGQAIIYRIRSGDGEFISGPEHCQITGHSDAINDLSFSPDSCHIVTCSSDGTIQLWDSENGKNLLKIQTKHGKLMNAKFAPNGKRVVVLATRSVSVWDLTSSSMDWESDSDGRNYQVLWCQYSLVHLSIYHLSPINFFNAWTCTTPTETSSYESGAWNSGSCKRSQNGFKLKRRDS